MEGSQSRYSIVERLTNTKLNLIQAKAELEEEIKGKEQKLESSKKKLADWKIDIQEEIRVSERTKIHEIEELELNLNNTKERRAEKEKMFDLKLTAINEALEDLKKISENAGPSTQ